MRREGKKKKWKRLIAVLIVICMAFSGSVAFSISAIAEDEQPVIEEQQDPGEIDLEEEDQDVLQEDSEQTPQIEETIPEVQQPEENIPNNQVQNDSKPQDTPSVKVERPSTLSLRLLGEEVRETDTVKVKEYLDGVYTEKEISIPVGTVDKSKYEELYKNPDGTMSREFQYFKVVLNPNDPTLREEHDVTFVGLYNGAVYYSYEGIAGVGIIKGDNCELQIAYRTVYQISYKVVNGMNGSVPSETDYPEAGQFKNNMIKESIYKGDELAVDFDPVMDGDLQNGYDYRILGLYMKNNDTGSFTNLNADRVGYALIKPETITGNITIYAVTEKIDEFHVYCVHEEGGYVCKECSAQYSDNPCKRGGTITLIAYSQALTGGGKWILQRLFINDVMIDLPTNPNEAKTTVINDQGMRVTYAYVDKKAKDVRGHHKFADNETTDTKDRNIYFIVIENVNEDVYYDIRCNEGKFELLELGDKVGISQVVASSFDRTNSLVSSVADYYDGIYNGDKSQDPHLITLYNKFPNRTGTRKGDALVWEDISGCEGKDILGRYPVGNLGMTQDKDGNNTQHTAVETMTVAVGTSGLSGKNGSYGSRYVYYQVEPGYDPSTVISTISGNGETELSVHNIAQASTKKTGGMPILGWFKTTQNKSLYQAKKSGYDYFVLYQGIGVRNRTINFKAKPYQVGIEYDTNGGSIVVDGKTYSSIYKVDDGAKNYTALDGSNTFNILKDAPVKDGYIFKGWKLLPQHEKYKTDKTVTNAIYLPGRQFNITGTTIEYALEKVATGPYELMNQDGGMVTMPSEYVLKTDDSFNCIADNKYVFEAQWERIEETDTRAPYNREIFKEVPAGTNKAVKNEENGKYYLKVDSIEAMGDKGQDIIAIPEEIEGYTFNEKISKTIVKNFMMQTPYLKCLKLYYDINRTDISVTVAVTGDYADLTKEFPVKVHLRMPENFSSDEYFSIAVGNAAGTREGVTQQGNKYAFEKSMGNGTEIVVQNVPENTTFWVEIINEDFYKEQVEYTIEDGKTSTVFRENIDTVKWFTTNESLAQMNDNYVHIIYECVRAVPMDADIAKDNGSIWRIIEVFGVAAIVLLGMKKFAENKKRRNR